MLGLVSLLHAHHTTETSTLSLHDALPIWRGSGLPLPARSPGLLPALSARLGVTSYAAKRGQRGRQTELDRKSTRLNSSHLVRSYAVFCLKKKEAGNAGGR